MYDYVCMSVVTVEIAIQHSIVCYLGISVFGSITTNNQPQSKLLLCIHMQSMITQFESNLHSYKDSLFTLLGIAIIGSLLSGELSHCCM